MGAPRPHAPASRATPAPATSDATASVSAPVDPLVAEYLAYLEFERTLSPNSVAAYRRDLTRFAAWLRGAGSGVLEADAEVVYRYFSERGGDGATTSVARRMAAVRGLYRDLVREKGLATDPAAQLATPKHAQALPHVLRVDEVETVLGGVPLFAKGVVPPGKESGFLPPRRCRRRWSRPERPG